MPCHAATSENYITASEGQSVESVMKAMKKAKAAFAVIVDEKNVLLGVFSKKILIKTLTPVSVAMADGIQIDVKVSAAPGVAKRLKNTMPLPVSEIMDRKPQTVNPDTPLWEGVGLLTKYNAPLVVVDGDKKFKGIITYDSLIENLENVVSSDN